MLSFSRHMGTTSPGAKLQVLQGLSFLNKGDFPAAARAFLSVNPALQYHFSGACGRGMSGSRGGWGGGGMVIACLAGGNPNTPWCSS